VTVFAVVTAQPLHHTSQLQTAGMWPGTCVKVAMLNSDAYYDTDAPPASLAPVAVFMQVLNRVTVTAGDLVIW
jgi:hypothetical protein